MVAHRGDDRDIRLTLISEGRPAIAVFLRRSPEVGIGSIEGGIQAELVTTRVGDEDVQLEVLEREDIPEATIIGRL